MLISFILKSIEKRGTKIKKTNAYLNFDLKWVNVTLLLLFFLKIIPICYAILDILFNRYDIYFNLLDIYYKEDILYSKYDIHFIILGIQNVNIRYPQCLFRCLI